MVSQAYVRRPILCGKFEKYKLNINIIYGHIEGTKSINRHWQHYLIKPHPPKIPEMLFLYRCDMRYITLLLFGVAMDDCSWCIGLNDIIIIIIIVIVIVMHKPSKHVSVLTTLIMYDRYTIFPTWKKDAKMKHATKYPWIRQWKPSN